MDPYQYDDGNQEVSFDMTGFGNSKAPKKSPASMMWRYVAVVGILGLTAFFAVSTTTGFGKMTSEKRIQLARTGRGDVRYADLYDEEKKVLFEEFKAKYDRQFPSQEEEIARFQIFLSNLEKADNRNAAEAKRGGSAVHGVTKFADRSDDEFKSLLGYRPTKPGPVKPTINYLSPISVSIDDYDTTDAPTAVDWSTSLATAVKDQGYCGSCWAFSATSQIESDSLRAGYIALTDTLSEQQIVSCDTTDYGCDGGYTEYAYSYVSDAGGLYSSTDYPYTSYYDQTGKCLASTLTSYTKYVTVTNYYALDSEATMAAHVLTTGPLSVCLDASDWGTYVSGIITTCGTDVDHCVQVTGLDTTNNYWIVRNSWGTEWGYSGYIYVEYGSNMCEIANDPTYVEVASL